MQTVTIYEATNPSGIIYTARLEGVACKGEGLTVSEALCKLANELSPATFTLSELGDKLFEEILNYVDIPNFKYEAVQRGIAEVLIAARRDSALNAPEARNEATIAPTPTELDKNVEINAHQVGGRHYKTAIQHWDFVLANGLGYMEGQITKYVARHAKKNGLEDLEKARHFLDKLIWWETKKKQEGEVDMRRAEN